MEPVYQSRMTTAFTILLLAASIADSNSLRNFAFRPNNHRLCSWSQNALTILRNVPPECDEVLGKEKEILKETIIPRSSDEETTLTLRGDFFCSSADLPKTSIEDVDEFFRIKANRDLLVTGGGARPCSEIKATPQQLKDWKHQCDLVGATQPDENDSILSIVSRGIQFPGLNVESNALIGAKYVKIEDEKIGHVRGKTANPRYEFVLIATEQIVSGLPPAVWLYKKLTGAGNSGDDENSTFDSLSTVTYEAKENGKIAFRTDSFLSIGVTFPKFLLKILPGDKKTIEERGSKSIVKTLDKDVVQAMKSLEKEYLESFNFTPS